MHHQPHNHRVPFQRFIFGVSGLVVLVFGGLIVLKFRQPPSRPVAVNRPPTVAQGPTGPFVPTEAAATPKAAPLSASTPLPTEVSLTVPFAEQAPHRVWDHDHEELCEEAASLMVGRYFAHRSVGTADDVDTALFELKDWEVAQLNGTWEDTTADQTATMIRDVYGLKVEVIDVTAAGDTPGVGRAIDTPGVKEAAITTIKRALADGKLVIVPTAGRKLGNPNFTPPGPLYHMLVLTGYTSDNQFITNDPGIWQGKDWKYSDDVLMNAIGDWNNGDPEHGTKIVLLVSK